MTQSESFAVTEAKDSLSEINAAISKTRDKSWQLAAYLIAIDVFLVQTFFGGTNNNVINGVSVLAFIASIGIFLKLNYSFNPTDMIFNGGGDADRLIKL